ncbi:hypothetical protein [Streptomyces rhizosphaerihabitans]|uniref:hypothetical protein n=1 Tax=Streptomyces rhizosphaerihabitans TaxID=1266770 RepID=UPI0028F70B20|nr:hypothetical protein [Streptomyces rhizosphaerihabitans]
MDTWTLESEHSEGSGSGDSDSEVLGAGDDAGAEPLGAGALADGDVGVDAGVDVGAEADSVLDDGSGVVPGALGDADSDVFTLGDGLSSANAAGATDSNASGAMTAVAAAVAMARRSFMKTSDVRCAVNSWRAYGVYG